MGDYIVKLAADSRNSKMFSLLASVNDSSVMHKILSLNQGEKIRDVCKPECIQWNKDKAEVFIDVAFEGLLLFIIITRLSR